MTEPRDQEDVKTPLSFKIMIVLVVLYLGWRLVEGVVWLWGKVF
ncbi:MAG TPA: hypothetical protein VEB69_05075 [Acidimicrobiia bacterium]|nr:hypothetical protein [Acidimicrobiia bacterium]